MFYNQLKAACKQNNTSVTAVLKKIGLGTANGTYWKNGSMPNSDVVIKLSESLGVTVDYLLTGKEPTSVGDTVTNSGSNIGIVGNTGSINHAPVTITIKNGEEHTRELSKQENDLIRIYNNANGRNQNEIMNFVYKYDDVK